MKNNKIINTLCLTLFVTFLMFSAEVNGDDKKNQSRGKSAPRAHTKEAFMESNDEDGDGIVSKEEFLAIREVSHNEKDLNKNGIVNGFSKLPVYLFSHYIIFVLYYTHGPHRCCDHKRNIEKQTTRVNQSICTFL